MERTITVKIDDSLQGRKIEYILQKHIGISSTLVKRLKRSDNAILLNGKRAAAVEKVCKGDELKIIILSKETANIAAVDMPLDILYEDEDVIAVNKPHSMPTHPSRNHQNDTLANGVVHYLGGEGTTIHVITRLDRDTSGVVLIAKNAVAAKFLTDDIQRKRVLKEYVAVVNGAVDKCGTVCAAIKRKEGSGILRCVSPDGKEAITEYEVIKAFGEFSLVKLCPITGRTHQLRVHMSYIGTPIYGDKMYGAPQYGERTRLHCRRLSFYHPMTKEEISVTAAIPKDITDLL